jgi:hypothetical protein
MKPLHELRLYSTCFLLCLLWTLGQVNGCSASQPYGTLGVRAYEALTPPAR